MHTFLLEAQREQRTPLGAEKRRAPFSIVSDSLKERLRASSGISLSRIFGIPHSFNPNLSLLEALWAVILTICRIFLGSTLFAAFGVAAWVTWSALPNLFLQSASLVLISGLFLGALLALLLGIHLAAAAVERIAARKGYSLTSPFDSDHSGQGRILL